MVSDVIKSGTVKVVIVDDHEIFRTALKNTLELEPDMKVIGEASNGVEALEVMAKNTPDVALVDITMPEMGGAELVRRMRSSGIKAHVIVLTAMDDEKNVMEISKAGVMGYVLKTSGFDDLARAIRVVHGGGSYVDSKVASTLLSGLTWQKDKVDLFNKLSEREIEVLFWLAQGLNGQEIADKLFLSDKTIKNHISHILAKLSVTDRTQAVSLAWKYGLASRSPDRISRP